MDDTEGLREDLILTQPVDISEMAFGGPLPAPYVRISGEPATIRTWKLPRLFYRGRHHGPRKQPTQPTQGDPEQ